ncbi:MAG: folylpolyglutamate synthase/dihydrofolate synthase family protein [Eubacteriales bacterium]|nr:folylpolyglutamate synthase/dihydrofolate synthase family protein [Eubacteriales bacterium]
MRYEEIEEYMESLSQYSKGTGVERGEKLLSLLGNPEENYKVIHVAGTNGKGSVCSYISSIIEKNGHSVGLFTSPHLIDIRERIQINRCMISKQDFEECFNEVLSAVKEDGNIEPAYFDYFFAVALVYFAKKKVEYVVLETGLGGKYDATNSVRRPVCTVITTIGLEHTAILGESVEEVASQKAGIIKEHIPVVYSGMNPLAANVIEHTAKDKDSPAVSVSRDDYEITKNSQGCIDFLVHNDYYINDCFRIETEGLYQAENAAIALTACKVMESEGIIELNPVLTRKGLIENRWAGRMEKITHNIYVDGAHNPQGIELFVESVRSICRNKSKKATLLFSVVSDKNFEDMIRCLCGCECFYKFAVTVTGGARKLSGDCIRETFLRYTDKPVLIYHEVGKAMEDLDDEELLMCAGSLYLVADIKRAVMKNGG